MKAATIPLVLALVLAAMVGAAGFGTRFGFWDFRFGFQLVRWSLYAGLTIAAVAIIALLIPRIRASHVTRLIAALLISIGISPWVQLLFPLWILLLSIHILRRSWTLTAPSGSNP